MPDKFARIALFAKPTGTKITKTLQQVFNFLQSRQLQVVVEQSASALLDLSHAASAPVDTIGEQADLAIIIGGDGSLLKAARAIVDYNIPIIGINRGSLGFLADLSTDNIEAGLEQILQGNYIEEQRTMLKAVIVRDEQPIDTHLALNDVVLHHGSIARLIEFQIYINDQFVINQRADGVIASTPTGSTAYALSGGGPIVYPTLDVLTLMPMFPHALNTRPIVIDENSKIKILLSSNNKARAKFSYDGQIHLDIHAGDEVHIQKHAKKLRLLHPKSYNYYAVLREKLGWNTSVS